MFSYARGRPQFEIGDEQLAPAVGYLIECVEERRAAPAAVRAQVLRALGCLLQDNTARLAEVC